MNKVTPTNKTKGLYSYNVVTPAASYTAEIGKFGKKWDLVMTDANGSNAHWAFDSKKCALDYLTKKF